LHLPEIIDGISQRALSSFEFQFSIGRHDFGYDPQR